MDASPKDPKIAGLPIWIRAKCCPDVLDQDPPSRAGEEETVPKFIDAHPMKPFTAHELKRLQHAPPDEFGITHHDILFSEKDDKIYCVLDAPNAEAIEKHHAKAGITCDWIREVTSTRG